MNILQLIASDNFIALNKDLIKILGLEEAILFGELASEQTYYSKRDELNEGYFYSTIENIEEKTTLSAHKQRKALKTLQDMKLIDVKVRGMPAKRYIKIDEVQLIKIFNNKLLKSLTTSSEKIEQLDVKKFNGNKNISNKNIKEESKKERNNSYDEIINDLIQDDELKNTIYDFIKMRQMIKKPMTDRALKMLINKLNKMSNNIDIQIKILEQSIINNWQDIYELKEFKKHESTKANIKRDGSEFSEYD